MVKDQLDKLMNMRVSLKTGFIACVKDTEGIFEPVDYILLAVCPNWHEPIKHHHKKNKRAQEKSKKLLKETIVNLLEMAKKLEVK